MPPASAAKPAVKESTKEMVGPVNHRSIPLYVSKNFTEFLDIFQHVLNLPYSLETFHFIQKSAGMSVNSLDSPEILHAVQSLPTYIEIF